MKDKLKSFFTTNIGFKILSLVLGFILWALLSNAQDPVIERTLEVPVTYINADLLNTQDNYILLDGPATVTINVSVRTSKQNSLKSELFTCTADLTDRSGGDARNQRVRIQVQQVAGYDTVIDWSYLRNDPNITVVLDEIVEREYVVELLQANGPGQGLHIGMPTFTPDYVTVRGPLSQFSSVAAVKALVDLSGVKSSEWYTNTVGLGLYDGNNNRIENSSISIYPDTVEVKVFVFGESSVNLSICYSKTEDAAGTNIRMPDWKQILKEGYVYAKTEIEPVSVNVHGANAASLNGSFAIPIQEIFDAYVTEIAAGTKEPLAGEWSFTVNLPDYLPAGVILSDPSMKTVTVKVFAEQEQERDVNVILADRLNLETGETAYAVSEKTYQDGDTPETIYFEEPTWVKWIGQDEAYRYVTDYETIVLRVKGIEEKLNVFAHTATGVTVNVSGLGVGVHEVEVIPEGMSGVEILQEESELTITVEIREAGEEEESKGAGE